MKVIHEAVLWRGWATRSLVCQSQRHGCKWSNFLETLVLLRRQSLCSHSAVPFRVGLRSIVVVNLRLQPGSICWRMCDTGVVVFFCWFVYLLRFYFIPAYCAPVCPTSLLVFFYVQHFTIAADVVPALERFESRYTLTLRRERGRTSLSFTSVALERSIGEERRMIAASRLITLCFHRLQQQQQQQIYKYTIVKFTRTISSAMPNTPPPVLPSPTERDVVEQPELGQMKPVTTGRMHRDSEADDWDSFLDSTSTFNPNAFHKRELAHRFAIALSVPLLISPRVTTTPSLILRLIGFIHHPLWLLPNQEIHLTIASYNFPSSLSDTNSTRLRPSPRE